jgi:hypothetical protein
VVPRIGGQRAVRRDRPLAGGAPGGPPTARDRGDPAGHL